MTSSSNPLYVMSPERIALTGRYAYLPVKLRRLLRVVQIEEAEGLPFAVQHRVERVRVVCVDVAITGNGTGMYDTQSAKRLRTRSPWTSSCRRNGNLIHIFFESADPTYIEQFSLSEPFGQKNESLFRPYNRTATYGKLMRSRSSPRANARSTACASRSTTNDVSFVVPSAHTRATTTTTAAMVAEVSTRCCGT